MTRVDARSAGPVGRPWYVSALVAVLAALLLLGGVWAYTRIKSPFPYYGTVYDAPQQAVGVSGLSFTGGKVTPYAFTPGEGKTTALFFGFTHCPDVCPATLAYLERARQAMTTAEKAKFQLVFVSLDPDRDTPQRLNEYAKYFGDARSVQVKEPALATLARSYAVSYVKAPLPGTGPGGDYQINHTSATFLIDAAGKKRLLWDVTQLGETARVLRDIRQVMKTSGGA
ncbi:SCO family protein [Deinococcus altitudinis]|uniref:SCO family protein n=1 Tax=Deinococcus altitudinis TaxID=468914 RepID=UPI003891AE3A